MVLGWNIALVLLSFESDVKHWLKTESNIEWSGQGNLLELSSSSVQSSVTRQLCLKPTPSTLQEALLEDKQRHITYLHQDIWEQNPDIAKSRIRAQLGYFNRRVFARKTTAQRIGATVAVPFLQENHQWGATKSKYYYGLLDKSQSEEEAKQLVAVASFSSRRNVQRMGQTHRSHELIRFCTLQDTTIVGGLSKLVKKFVVEQTPDDIVTVLDGDWSTSAWQTLGFESVHTMPPMVMVVSPNEPGTRRHLVGAGLQQQGGSRLGLPKDILNELELIDTAQKALECLAGYDYFPVYDAGVDRLFRVIDTTHDATELWRHSIPTYATSYYSDNPGIAALLRYAETGVL
jgi:hypothetical protein